MRLYAILKTDRRPFYVSSSAKVRSELPPSFYLTCPYNHINLYLPRYIFAETSESNTATGGALAGGLVGLLAGGIGAIVGAIAGAALGTGRERQDTHSVERFNNST